MKFGLTVFSVLLLTAGEMLAQSDRASTTGTVKDASGAVISGVQVTVTNPRTALLASADTNAQGVYAVPRPGSRLHPVPSGEPARGAGVLHDRHRPPGATRIVRLGVSAATSGDVRDQPKVADAASELLQDVFGKDKNPCRLVYGVASLPLGSPVELEVIFEVSAR